MAKGATVKSNNDMILADALKLLRPRLNDNDPNDQPIIEAQLTKTTADQRAADAKRRMLACEYEPEQDRVW